MADGLFTPRSLRRETALGEALVSLEAPECRCEPPPLPVCFAGKDDHPARCPGPAACKDCPTPPCACLLAIDPDAFPLSLEEWAELLYAYDPAGYAEPPAAPPWATATSAARVRLLQWRAARGLALRHPQDVLPVAGELEHLHVRGCSGKKQGELRACWHEDEDDPADGMGLDVERAIDPADRVQARALALDRAVERAMRLAAGLPAPLRREWYALEGVEPARRAAVLDEASRRGLRLYRVSAGCGPPTLALYDPRGRAAQMAALLEALGAGGRLEPMGEPPLGARLEPARQE